MADWVDTFGESFLFRLPAADRAGAIAEIVAELAPKLRGPDGIWVADYVRLRIHATKAAP